MRQSNEEFQAEVFRRSRAYKQNRTRRIATVSGIVCLMLICLPLTRNLALPAAQDLLVNGTSSSACCSASDEAEGASSLTQQNHDVDSESSESETCSYVADISSESSDDTEVGADETQAEISVEMKLVRQEDDGSGMLRIKNVGAEALQVTDEMFDFMRQDSHETLIYQADTQKETEIPVGKTILWHIDPADYGVTEAGSYVLRFGNVTIEWYYENKEELR